MRTVAIVQARMGNSRLPGKNGRLILGKPQIYYVLERVKRAMGNNDVMMAIPHEANGGIQIDAARALGVEVLDYRGNPDDLIHRYALAADIMDADVVVRVPGDNTFVDVDEVQRIVSHYHDDPPAWNWLTTNLDRDVLGNGYPGGLGAEVYDSLYFHKGDKLDLSPRHREHPHFWAMDNKRVRTVQAPEHVWAPWEKYSVDTEAEWEETKRIYEALYPSNPDFRIRDILKYLGEPNEQ